MWPFKRKPFLEPEASEWHVNNLCWLIHHLYDTPMFQQTKLVLPAPGCFKTDAKGHELAVAILEQVKQYAGMADWPVDLISDIEVHETTRELFQIPQEPSPLGTFMLTQGHAQISYAPHMLKKPVKLISTLAHEMAHYLIHSIDDELPCEAEAEELLTDQTACFLGFGVFIANNAFEFEQWREEGLGTQGWSTQRNGYLSEPDLVFNLALFMTLKDISADQARPWLKPHLWESLKSAMKDMPFWAQRLETAKSEAVLYSTPAAG